MCRDATFAACVVFCRLRSAIYTDTCSGEMAHGQITLAERENNALPLLPRLQPNILPRTELGTLIVSDPRPPLITPKRHS